jgi:rod shape determining protein RodA
LRIDYNLKDKFDIGLFLPAILLMCIGLAAIFSSTSSHPTASGNFEKQLIFGIAAILVFLITYFLPTNFFRQISTPTYLLAILLLMAVLLFGKKVSGAKAWLDLGPLGFQPAELAKIGTILAVSAFLTRMNNNIESIKDIFFALIIGFIPVCLILLQPDMGTGLVFLGIILAVLFWKGISLFGLFLVLSPGFVAVAAIFGDLYFITAIIIVVGLLLLFQKDIFTSGSILGLNLGAGFFAEIVYHALSPHQQVRIQSFMDPDADPLGAGYNAIQAKVAIGSGGFFGKGFLNGNQTQLQYIPEQWTDFIYCVIGEEFGFIGAALTLVLFLILFVRLIKIASLTKDEFLSLTIVGVLSVYFVHLAINVGMTVGIMPVIGIPLPFVSYGGSSLLVNMFMLGIAANVYRTRKNYT